MPVHTETPPWQPCSNAGCWMRLIVAGGLISAFSFILFEILVSWLFSGRPFILLRFFAAPILGMRVVATTYPRLDAVIIGLVVLSAISIASAYVLAAFLSQFPDLTTSTERLVTSACILGYILWIVDFLLLDQAIIANDLTVKLHPGLQGFVGHVFFYGMVLGWFVVRNQERYPRVMNVRFRF